MELMIMEALIIKQHSPIINIHTEDYFDSNMYPSVEHCSARLYILWWTHTRRNLSVHRTRIVNERISGVMSCTSDDCITWSTDCIKLTLVLYQGCRRVQLMNELYHNSICMFAPPLIMVMQCVVPAQCYSQRAHCAMAMRIGFNILWCDARQCKQKKRRSGSKCSSVLRLFHLTWICLFHDSWSQCGPRITIQQYNWIFVSIDCSSQ